MTTINDVPRDVIATGVIPHLPFEGRNSLMRTSKHFMAVCQSDPVWAPMVRALFLNKDKEETNYEAVRGFHFRFNDYSDLYLPKPEPVLVFGRISNFIKGLLPDQAPPAKKEIPFEANIQRWKAVQNLSWHVAYIATSPLGLDLAIAFQFHRINPTMIGKVTFCIAAIEKGYLPQVAWFLENQLLTVNEQGCLLIRAVQIVDLAAVNMLLELGQISEKDRMAAIGYTQECDTEIIKKLKQDANIN